MSQHRLSLGAPASDTASEAADALGWAAVLTAILFMILVVAAVALGGTGSEDPSPPNDWPTGASVAI